MYRAHLCIQTSNRGYQNTYHSCCSLDSENKIPLCCWPSLPPLSSHPCASFKHQQCVAFMTWRERSNRKVEGTAVSGGQGQWMECWDQIMGQVRTGCKEHKCYSGTWEELSWDLWVRICLHPRDEQYKQLLSFQTAPWSTTFLICRNTPLYEGSVRCGTPSLAEESQDGVFLFHAPYKSRGMGSLLAHQMSSNQSGSAGRIGPHGSVLWWLWCWALAVSPESGVGRALSTLFL